MKKITVIISGMNCAACSAAAEKALNKLDGVSANVNLATEKAYIEFDEAKVSEEQLSNAVSKVGFKMLDEEEYKKIRFQKKEKERKSAKIRMITALAFSIPLFYIAMGPMIGLPSPINDSKPVLYAAVQLILAIPVMIAGIKFYLKGFPNLFKLHPNMDSLVAVGTTSAFLYSVYSFIKIIRGDLHAVHHLYFESTAIIIALVMLGKYLEANSRNKTGEAVKKLNKLSPKTAVLITPDGEKTVSVEDIKIGDTILIKPGERFCCDGKIWEGHTTADESMLTGESLPVEKTKGDSIFAGTVNLNGTASYTAEKVGFDTSLSHIIKMVEEASGSKAPIAKIADKVAGVFVTAVIIIAVISSLIWYITSKDFELSLKIFISVLVIACPCALGLATPTAIITATGRAAEKMILFKNAEALEYTNRITTVIFDKTGTITEGKPVVTDIVALHSEENELISIAASIEKFSEHPIAHAIVDYANKNKITLHSVENFSSTTGFGVSGEINSKLYYAGKPQKTENNQFNSFKNKLDTLTSQGKTVICISDSEKVLGLIAVADEIKESSSTAVQKLNKLGIKTVMLTGDNKTAAEYIASKAGIKEVIAEVLPNEKEKTISEFKAKGEFTAMCGDGINDAPALTTADVGIAVGSGTDIAIDCADIVLVKNDLNDVSEAIRISKATLRNIKQNLFWAFCYNSLGIPVAAGLLYAFGGPLLNPMIAAAAMSLSSVSVVTNALRLNRL